MDTPTDNSSLDESSLEEPWPDCYFYHDGESPPSAENPNTPASALPEPPTVVSDPVPGAITLADLPQDILFKIIEPLGLQSRFRFSKCSKALQEIVGASKWVCPGNGTLEIVSYGWTTCGFNLGRVFQTGTLVHNDAASNKADSILPFFPWFSHLFGKLHLKVLRMRNVRTLLTQPVYAEFFDKLVFDDLIMVLNPDPSGLVKPRSMMASANRILNLIEQARNDIWSFPADDFVKLADRDHTLIGFMPSEFSLEQLAHVIKCVSTSSLRQRIDIRVYYDICQKYVDSVEAKRSSSVLESLELTDEEQSQYRAFAHLGAAVLLRSIEGAGKNSRVIIASQALRNQCVDQGRSPWELFRTAMINFNTA